MIVGLYTRVSTDEQVENGYSLDAQKRKLQQYATTHNFQIYKVYSDEGISGKTITERPELTQLLEDCKQHKIDAVVVCKVDRLSRNLLDLLTIKNQLDTHRIELIITDEAVNPNDDSGMAMFSMMGVFAELERKKIAERMMMGKRELALSGIKSRCGNMPFGYTFDIKTKRYEPNDKAYIVKFIYEKLNNYVSANKIAAYLQSTYRLKLRSSDINVIAKNPIYKGFVALSYYDNIHKMKAPKYAPIVNRATNITPIVTEELWDSVNNILKDNQYIKKKTAPCFYLHDVLYCVDCGYRVSTKQTTAYSKYKYYRCASADFKGSYINGCSKAWLIRMDDLHTQFLDFIKNINTSSISSKKSIIGNSQALQNEIQAYRKQIDKKISQKNTLLDKLSEGIISDKDYIDTANRISNEIDSLNNNISICQQKYDEMENINKYQEYLVQQVKQAKNLTKFWNELDDNEKKRIVNETIDKIWIKDKKIVKIELK